INMVVSLDSVDKSEQAISKDTRCTLLMHNTRSASGGSHGVHYMLLSTPAMHALWPTRLRRASGPLWSRSWHPATAMHHVSGHVFGAPRHGILRCACGGRSCPCRLRINLPGSLVDWHRGK